MVVIYCCALSIEPIWRGFISDMENNATYTDAHIPEKISMINIELSKYDAKYHEGNLIFYSDEKYTWFLLRFS